MFNVDWSDFLGVGRATYIPSRYVEQIFSQMRPVNRLVCQFCLETGFRVDDVLEMRTQDIYNAIANNNCWLSLLEKKTGKHRNVRINKRWGSMLMGIAGVVYVFEGKDIYTHRTRQAVYADFKRRARFVLGDNTSASVHSLRKIYAVELYGRTGSLERVKRDLNHTHMSTTLLYALADKIGAERPREQTEGLRT